MKILLVNKFYFEETRSGGVGTYVLGLQKILEKKGNRVIPWGVNEPETISNAYQKYFLSPVETGRTKNVFRILKTLGRFFWSFEARRKLRRLLQKEKIDVAHLNNIYHQMSPSFLPILKKARIPVVMTVHDYNLVCPNYNMCLNGKEYKRAIGGRYWQCVTDRCVQGSLTRSLVLVLKMYFHNKILKIYQKNVDIFVAPSDFVKQKLVEAGFPEGKIRVLPHFVEMGTDCKGIESRDDFVLAFGRLSEEKGFQNLISVMKSLPNEKLKIAGEGPFRAELEKKVEKLGLRNVEFLGHLSKSDLQKNICHSKLVVVPSLSPEVFGFSVAESVALGATVLASRVGSLPQFLDEDNLFEAGDEKDLLVKMIYLIENNKNNKTKKIDEVFLDEHSPDKYYESLFQIYRKIGK